MVQSGNHTIGGNQEGPVSLSNPTANALYTCTVNKLLEKQPSGTDVTFHRMSGILLRSL